MLQKIILSQFVMAITGTVVFAQEPPMPLDEIDSVGRRPPAAPG